MFMNIYIIYYNVYFFKYNSFAKNFKNSLVMGAQYMICFGHGVFLFLYFHKFLHIISF